MNSPLQIRIAGRVAWEGDLAAVLRIDRSCLEVEAGKQGETRAEFARLRSEAVLAEKLAEAEVERLKGALFLEAKDTSKDPLVKPPSDTTAEATRRASPKMLAALEALAHASSTTVLLWDVTKGLEERGLLLRELLYTERHATTPGAVPLSPEGYRTRLDEARAAKQAREDTTLPEASLAPPTTPAPKRPIKKG